MKYEVLKDCQLAVKAGSIVIVSEEQVRYAKEYLKELDEKKPESKAETKETKKKKGE